MKLKDLLSIEGIDDDDMFSVANDSVQPGICINDDCDYTTQVEPDQEEGYCEECETNTVKSLQCLIL